MFRLGNKAIVYYAIFLLLLTTSCAPKLGERVEEFLEAAKNNDVEKVMSFYADDARFEIVGAEVAIEGKEALRRAVEREAILNARHTFTDIKVEGNTATFKATGQNDILKTAGIGALDYEYDRITFNKDGLIQQERAKPTQESMKCMGMFQESLEKWASEKRGPEWAKLQAEDVTKENVSEWLALIREWREENDLGELVD
jgi:ketosteroid isomerase-like protein